MGDIEATVAQALSDVKKLENQIDALLDSLKNNDTILEADLIPFSCQSLPKNVPTKSTQKKSSVIKESLVPMDVEDNKLKDMDRLQEIVTFRGGFVPVESEIVLVPVFDKWVFAITLTNKSNRPLCTPDLLLTMTSPNSKNSCSAFSYNVQINLIGVNLENRIPSKRTTLGIPYQNSMSPAEEDIQLGKVPMVQSGCQVLLTACFDHPIQFCDDNNRFILLISISSGGQHLWSRSMTVNYTEINSLYNDETVNKYKNDILTALSTCQDHFNVEQLTQTKKTSKLSKSSLDLNLNSLFMQLGFENIKSESMENDVIVDTMAPQFNSILGGSIFKLEKRSTKSDKLRCLISTRSAEQIQIFYRIFYKWLQDRQSERRQTIKVSPSDSKNCNDLINVLNSEVSHLFKLVHLNIKGLSSDASSKRDIEWTKEYYKCLAETDSVVCNISL